MGVHHTRQNNPFADRCCHTQMENKNGDHIEEGRKYNRLPRLENARRDHGGN